MQIRGRTKKQVFVFPKWSLKSGKPTAWSVNQELKCVCVW